MVEWYLIAILAIVAFYISCWLGVEMIAYNMGYQLTHLQMFFVPALCLITGFVLLFSDNWLIIKSQPCSGSNYRMFFLREKINYMLLMQYLLHGGKLSLCMWAMHEAYSKKCNESENIFDVIKIKLIESIFPIIKDVTYSVSITLTAPIVSVTKIPKPSRKSTIALDKDTAFKEVTWNYGVG